MADLDFDVFSKNDFELCRLCIDAMNDLGVIRKLNIDMGYLGNWINAIANQYKDNPYHNWKHGFSVFSCCYSFLKKTELCLSSWDMFALCIAAIAHDVDHPGNTNDFEINIQSKYAILHNDTSVLEHHHCNVTFAVLKQPDCNFMEKFDFMTKKHFRRRVIGAILATDMSHHFNMCLELDKADTCKVRFPDPKDDANIQFLINIITHCADLCAQVHPWEIAQKWGECVRSEFIKQAYKEKAANIPVSTFMMEMENDVKYLKSQIGFIDFILKPLWKQVARLFPMLGSYYFQLLYNRDKISRAHQEKEELLNNDNETNDRRRKTCLTIRQASGDFVRDDRNRGESWAAWTPHSLQKHKIRGDTQDYINQRRLEILNQIKVEMKDADVDVHSNYDQNSQNTM